MWTRRNPTFERPNGSSSDHSYYHLINLASEITGNYSFRSKSSLNISAYLYSPSLDERSPFSHLIAFDDGSSNDKGKCRLLQTIVVDHPYYLVITMSSPHLIGIFNLFIRGLISIDLTAITGSFLFDTFGSNRYSQELLKSMEISMRLMNQN